MPAHVQVFVVCLEVSISSRGLAAPGNSYSRLLPVAERELVLVANMPRVLKLGLDSARGQSSKHSSHAGLESPARPAGVVGDDDNGLVQPCQRKECDERGEDRRRYLRLFVEWLAEHCTGMCAQRLDRDDIN